MSFVPAASTYEAAGDLGRLQNLYREGTRALMAVSLPILVTLLVRGRTFIGLWMGQQYRHRSGTVLIILASALIFSQANCAAFAIAFGTDKNKITARWAIGEGVANLGLSVLLVHFFGIYGVAVGTLIPNLFVNLVLWPRYIGRQVGMRSWEVMVKIWGPMLLSAVPFAIASYAVNVRFAPGSKLVFFAQTLLLLPIFFLTVLWMFRGEFRDRVLPLLRSKLPGRPGLAAQ